MKGYDYVSFLNDKIDYFLREHLKRDDVIVSDKILSRSTHPSIAYNIGMGLSIESILTLISGVGKSFDKKPVLPVIVPPIMNTRVLMSDKSGKTLVTNFGYEFEDDVIHLVEYQKPLPLLGYSMIEGEADTLFNPLIPRNRRIGSLSIAYLAENKLLVKDIFKENGLPITDYVEVNSRTSKEDLEKILAKNFRDSDEVVVKGNRGSKGSRVGIFNKDELDNIITYLSKILPLDEFDQAYIEKRFNPKPLYVNGKRQDWNFRTFVTIDNNSKFLGGAVRYNDHDLKKPVNFISGGKIGGLSMAPISNSELDEVIELTKKVGQIVFHETLMYKGELPTTYVGVDIMHDENDGFIINEIEAFPGVRPQIYQLGLYPEFSSQLLSYYANSMLSENKLDIIDLIRKFRSFKRFNVDVTYPYYYNIWKSSFYDKIGENEKARSLVKEAYSLAPNDPAVNSALDYLGISEDELVLEKQ